MNKITCNTIRDLLPLYMEDLASDDSRDLVETHLSTCPGCQRIADQMKESTPKSSTSDYCQQNMSEIQPLKAFRRRMKRHSAGLVAAGVFLTVWMICLIWGALFLQPGDEMGYSLLVFYLLLPATAFGCTLAAALKKSLAKWLLPILFGIAGFILPAIIFGSLWDEVGLFFAAIPAGAGLLVGLFVSKIKRHM